MDDAETVELAEILKGVLEVVEERELILREVRRFALSKDISVAFVEILAEVVEVDSVSMHVDAIWNSAEREVCDWIWSGTIDSERNGLRGTI